MINVVISVFNEENNPYLMRIIERFANYPLFELIFVDGGSSDNTVESLKEKNHNVLVLPNSTRAARLNYGITLSQYDFILLQHPRSLISQDGIIFLQDNYQHYPWAAFTHQFDCDHFFLRFVSWYSNRIRICKKKITYLDHCIFFHKTILKQAMPDIAIFEDTELSFQLQKKAFPKLLPLTVTTSAIRFLERGIFKHFLLNQFIKLLHSKNIDPSIINRLYEKRLNLNQKNERQQRQ